MRDAVVLQAGHRTVEVVWGVGEPTGVPLIAPARQGFGFSGVLGSPPEPELTGLIAAMRRTPRGPVVAVVDPPVAPRPLGLAQSERNARYIAEHGPDRPGAWREFHAATTACLVDQLDARYGSASIVIAHAQVGPTPQGLIEGVLTGILEALIARPLALRRAHLLLAESGLRTIRTVAQALHVPPGAGVWTQAQSVSASMLGLPPQPHVTLLRLPGVGSWQPCDPGAATRGAARCGVCGRRPAAVVRGSSLGKFISLGYCGECGRRGAEPLEALEMRAGSIGWARVAGAIDDLTTFHDGRYVSFREALAGTPRGRQLEALRGDALVRAWLDDDLVDRAAPDGWVQVTSAREAIELLGTGRVVELSLDHDLGDDERCGRGIDVVDWLAEQQEVHGRMLWPRDGITLHTANPAGRETMARAIERYAAKRLEVRRSVTPSGKTRYTFARPA